jgi:hypothetical protein
MKKLFFAGVLFGSGAASRAAEFRPSRLVFVNTPGAAESSEEVTLANLRDKILEQEGTMLDKKQVEKAVAIVEKGTDEEKYKVMDLFKKLINGHSNGKEFSANLPKNITKPKSANDNGAEDGEEAQTEDKETPEEKVKIIASEISQKVKDLLLQVQQMEGSLAAANDNAAGPEINSEETRKKLQQLGKEMEILNDLDDKAEKPLNDLVKKHHKDGKFTEMDAIQILNIRTTDKDFENIWEKLKAKLSPEEAAALQKTMQDTESETKKIEEDFKKRAKEAFDIMRNMTEIVNIKMDQANAIDKLSQKVGFPIRPGTKLRYKYLKDMGAVQKSPASASAETTRFAVIREIKFDDIELKDADGKVVKKSPSLSPTIVMDWEQEDTKEKGTFNFTEVQFKKNVDIQDICEVVEGLNEESLKEERRGQNLSLEALIGEKIKAGDVFEYREKTLDAQNRPMGADKKVRVVSIDESKQEIMMDTDVITADYPEVKKEKVLSYGNFAKWYRRMEAVKEIHGLKDLREKLKDLQNLRNNSIYKDAKTGIPRDAETYPPIEVTPGEELKYDDINEPAFFKIKDADDNKITLENGGTYTPGTFYNWIKNHEVEKATPKNGLKPPSTETMPANDNGGESAENDNAKEYQDSDFKEEIQSKKESKNSFMKIWDNTMFCTPADMMEVLARFKKFIIGKKAKKIKERQFKLGKTLTPGMDPLFRALKIKKGGYKELEADFESDIKGFEKEKVAKVKEMLKDYGPYDLKAEFYKAFSPDWSRAIMELLAAKGEIRWDDRNMWDALNRVTKGEFGQINSEVDLQRVIDGKWNEGFYHEMRSNNDGKYNKTRGDFMEKAERLSADPNNTGGLEGECRRLLFMHMRGEYVNPAEYEAYLAYAIKNGKMLPQDRLYFLVMGMGARGTAPKIEGWKFPADKNKMPIGDTLLPTDRYSKLESEFLVRFPIIEYFLTDVDRLTDDGKVFPTGEIDKKTGKRKVVKGPALKGNWIKMVNENISADLASQASNLDPLNKPEDNAKGIELFKRPDKFNNWIDREMVWDENFRIRLAEKASTNVSSWDHDDFHFFGPLISEGSVRQLVTYQGGGEQKTSIAGLKNTFAGFNNYLFNTFKYLDEAVKNGDKSDAENNSRRMVNLLRSFTRFDSIVSDRFEPGGALVRLGDRELNSAPAVDPSRPTYEHKAEINQFMAGLCSGIGMGEQWNEITKYVSPDESGAMSKRSNLIKAFGPLFEGAIYNYIEKNKLEGFNALVQKIQNENGSIQGIKDMQKEKVSKSELGDTKVTLQKYESPDLKAKVQKLRDLQSGKGRKNKSQIVAEDAALLSRVVDLIDNNQFPQVTGDGIAILEKTIKQLEAATDAEEGKAPGIAPKKRPPNPAPGGKNRKAA